MTDQPADQPADSTDRTGGTEQPPIADTIRAKLEEYEVERHLEEFASQMEHVVRQGIEMVGAFAHDHRDDITGFLARTAEALDRRTDGRHASTIDQVRGQLERGVERVADQRPGDADDTGSGSGPEEG